VRSRTRDEIALRGDPLFGIRFRGPATDESRLLRNGIAGHQPDLVALGGEASLDELDSLDDHGHGAAGLHGRNGGQDPGPNDRVDDRLEIPQRGRIREDQPTERGSVELDAVSKQSGTEPLDHGCQRRFAWVEHVSSDLVGVDDDYAGSLAEPPSNRRLAAADRAGDPDPDGPLPPPPPCLA
jgi:hypothetical protein